MLLLAGWSHSTSGAGWLMAGHAIRCAVQLGVHKALPRLERRKARQAAAVSSPGPPGADTPTAFAGMDVEPSTGHENEAKNDKALITSVRTWLALYVFGVLCYLELLPTRFSYFPLFRVPVRALDTRLYSYLTDWDFPPLRISFGTGRPAMMKADQSILSARDILLGHPLSTATDSRLVSTCELLTIQGKINDALGPLDRPVNGHTFDILRDATLSIDSWLTEWDGFMGVCWISHLVGTGSERISLVLHRPGSSCRRFLPCFCIDTTVLRPPLHKMCRSPGSENFGRCSNYLARDEGMCSECYWKCAGVCRYVRK